MDSIGLQLYQLVRNKDYDWANKMVSQVRLYWSQLYPGEKASTNRRYLMDMESMDKIEKGFVDSKFKKREQPFKPLPIMFKIINELSETLIQEPPKCEVRSADPASISGKKKDMNILRTRKIYEQGINKANRTIGEPPVKMDLKEKAQSNVDKFDDMGLEDNDEEDLLMFEQYFQKMNFEIAAQELINQTMLVNKFDEFNLREGLIDIGSANALCYDVYVDELTGQLSIQKIPPEQAKGLWGDAYDGSEDDAKGYEQSMPLRRFLGMVGNKFDLKRDWPDLLWAINGCNNTTFTGFTFGVGGQLDTYGLQVYDEPLKQYGCNQSRLMPLDSAYHYNVMAGKMEWYAPDCVSNDYLVDRITGQVSLSPITFDEYQKNEKYFSQYEMKSEIKWKAYNAVYLAYTLTTQKLYRWGEVYLQQPIGANDEYCLGTLKYYRLPGKPIGELIQIYKDIANEAIYKIKWILSNAKPRAKQVVFNEIIAMARALGTDKNGQITKDGLLQNNSTDLLEQVFNYMEQRVEYDIRFNPQVRGVDQGIPTLRSADEGMDPLAVAIQMIEQWAEQQIADKIGLNDIRQGKLNNDREGVAQSKLTTQFSLNQTGYISRIVQFCKKDVATTLLNYAHDIVKYKQSVPAKWIEVLLGEEKYGWLQNLGDYAPHRMGIFINDFTTEKIKRDVDQMVDLALQKGNQNQPGGITVPQAFFLKTTLDYKNEMRMLEVFIKKQDKKLRKQVEQDRVAVQENQMALKKAELEIVEREGQLALEKQQLVLEGTKYTADKNYQAHIDVKAATMANEDKKQEVVTNTKKDLESHKANLEQQAAI